MANSPSWLGLRGVLERCDKVDLRSEEVRHTGDCAPEIGELLKEKLLVASLYWRGDSSGEPRCAGVGSKMLSKSFPRLPTPWRLRRFAMGLDPGDPLRFMRPSFRLSGLDFAGGAGDNSARRANSNLMGLSSTSSRLSMSMVSGDSALGLRTGVFS